jgi:hypothetical protein
MPSGQTQFRIVFWIAVAVVVLAALGVATAWLAPAGLGALIGLGAARVLGGRRDARR